MLNDAINLRTLVLLTTFVSMTTAGAMMILWRSHRDDRSLPVWALGALLVAAGYLGVALRSWMPPFVSIPLANTCITIGHACFLVGVDRLTGRKAPAWPVLVALGLAVLAALWYFTYVEASTAIRMAIQFVTIGLLSVITARRLLASSEPANRLPHRAAAAVLMSYGLVLLIRVGLMPFDVPEQNLFAPNAIHYVVFIIMPLFYAALMYCFPALLFAKEIALRQRTEASLRDSESDYRSILATTLDGFWTVNPQGRLIDVNDRYVQQSGYPREELLGMSVSDLEAAETAEATAAHIRRVVEAGSDQFETLHRRKDGSTWNVEVTAIHLPAQGGRFFGFFRDISERKKTEAAILAARNQLQATLRAIPDLLFEMDLDGRYYDVYAMDRDLLAAPVDTLLSGRTVREVLPAEAAEVVLSALREAHEKGQSHGRQIELAVPQGRSWFEFSVAKKPAEPDLGPRFVVLSRDISKRKHAEAELRLTTERLQEAQRIAQIGSWTLDATSAELHWSDETFQLFELDPKQSGASYETFLAAVHPDDRDLVNQTYKDSLKTRSPYDITHRLRMGDGRIKWVQERCTSDFDETGKPLRSQGTVQDVTERVLAESALQASEKRFHQMLDDMLEGCMLIGFDWTYLYVNDVAARHGHQERRNLIDRKMTEVYPGIEQSEIFGIFRQVMEDRRPRRCETTYDFPDGSTGSYEFSVRPTPEGIFVLSLDITERRNALEALRASEASKAAILNSVAATVAVVDRNGVILEVNDPWRRFALENGSEPGKPAPHTAVGDNYLAACEASIGLQSDNALEARDGIQAVLDGRLPGFRLEYPCHSPLQQRWFIMMVAPLGQDARDGVVITHTDISQVKRSEERLALERQQRDTLVREVHHRIKNNLQSVAGLLQRELGKFVELDPRLATAIGQVHAIAIVHGLQSDDPDEAIRLCDSVRNICKTVSDLSQRPVLFHIEHEQTRFRPVRIESSEAVAVALVLNELILNAVKHSPEGGAAPTVSFEADGASARIVIRNALAAAPRFSIDTGHGLGTGLNLVRSLLPDRGAELQYEIDAEGFMLTILGLTSPVVATTLQKQTD